MNPVVVVNVEDPRGLGGPILGRAQKLATAVYQRAGVTLQWTLEATTQPDRVLTIILTTSVAAPAGLATDSMGVALSPEGWQPGNDSLYLHGQSHGVL